MHTHTSVVHRHHRGGDDSHSQSRQCWPADQSGQDGRATGAATYIGPRARTAGYGRRGVWACEPLPSPVLFFKWRAP